MSQWIARKFTLDRDGFRLSVSLGDVDRGYHELTWCWFICRRESFYWKTIAQGECGSLEDGQAAASEWIDRHTGCVCTRCGITQTEATMYCTGDEIPHPAGPEQASQHHFEDVR